MKKNIAIVIASYFAVASAALSVSAYQSRIINFPSASTVQEESVLNTYAENIDKPQEKPVAEIKEQPQVLTASIPVDTSKTIAPKTPMQSKQEPSRGGNPIPKAPEKATAAAKSVEAPKPASKSKVETLDWWKQANAVFKIGSKVVVEDVYTGKTFTIVRTMGSNHADCEAATKADADIIKSIWGGYSWNIRPVIINVNGRRLAASMSAMPHAGIDSAPAFAEVDNRSVGYGRGQNLDVVKGNSMDGHFDVHFLNSTRHKDGQVDSRHQAAIKVAGSK
jgi:hypothetical protein